MPQLIRDPMINPEFKGVKGDRSGAPGELVENELDRTMGKEHDRIMAESGGEHPSKIRARLEEAAFKAGEKKRAQLRAAAKRQQAISNVRHLAAVYDNLHREYLHRLQRLEEAKLA